MVSIIIWQKYSFCLPQNIYLKYYKTVAVEIELSPKNAVTNFRQDIDAGFTRTIIACKNIRVKKEIENKITSFIEKNPVYAEKARIILLSQYPFLKKLSSEIRGE